MDLLFYKLFSEVANELDNIVFFLSEIGHRW